MCVFVIAHEGGPSGSRNELVRYIDAQLVRGIHDFLAGGFFFFFDFEAK